MPEYNSMSDFVHTEIQYGDELIYFLCQNVCDLDTKKCDPAQIDEITSILMIEGRIDYKSTLDDFFITVDEEEDAELLKEICANYLNVTTFDVEKIKSELLSSDEAILSNFCDEYSVDIKKDEIYEKIFVSDYLASLLEEEGEVIKNLLGMKVWGRTQTNVPHENDEVLIKIAQKIGVEGVDMEDYGPR